MEAKERCPICGDGVLTVHVDQMPAEYNDVKGHIASHYSICNKCGSEQAGTEQLRRNKRAMIAFKKQASGLLSGEQVRQVRLQLKLSQKEAAEIFGGGPVAFSKYENDDVMQSEAMDKLLRVVQFRPDTLKILRPA